MPIKLVALDLDDTLLDPELHITPECEHTIRMVRQRGIIITISTGRMFRSALPYARQLGLAVPLITYEGAWVKHSESGEVLYSKPVPRDLAREVMDYFRVAGIHYHSYYDDQLVMESLTAEGEAYARLAGVKPHLITDLRLGLRSQEAMKIMAISRQESELVEMECQLQERYGQLLHITRSKPMFLEIMHAEADKARALQVAAAHFGLDRSEVMAIGDSYNDLEMITWAGIGVAMGNAVPPVKAAADMITSANWDNGVAQALRKLMLEQGSVDQY